MNAIMNLTPGAGPMRMDWMQGLIALGVLLLAIGGVWALAPGKSPLTEIELRGDFSRLQPMDVRKAAEPWLSDGFFAIDMRGLHKAIAALPWVAEVQVERRWPGRIVVHVRERVAVARWNANAVLDARGESFTPRPHEVPAGLPRLGGRSGTEAEVGRTWMRMARALAGTALALEGISLNDRGQWIARSKSGIELRFGQAPPDQRMGSLQGVGMAVLEGRWNQVAYIDLRYTNGFAVGWREAGNDQGALDE